MDVTSNPTPPPVGSGAAPASGTPEPTGESSSSKLVTKWAAEIAPEATIQAIAEAKAYAEAHVEMVIPKRRGRPRKNPLPEGTEGVTPTPAPVPKRVSLPKFRPPPKPKAKTKRKKKRDDYDDSDDDSEGDFVPEPIQRRHSERGAAKRAGFFSDGDVDSEEEEFLDDDTAYRVANQRVSLRQKKRLNYADHFRGDDTDDEDDAPKKKGGKKAGGRPRAQSMGDLSHHHQAPASMEEEAPAEEEDDEEEYNKPTKTGLVPDMAYRSVQIERVLAFRARKVNTADPHSFPTVAMQPNKLAGPNPPPEGTAAAFAMAARASGSLTDVLMTIHTHIPGVPTPVPQSAPATPAASSLASGASAAHAESSFASPAPTPALPASAPAATSTTSATAETASMQGHNGASSAAAPGAAPATASASAAPAADANPNTMDVSDPSTTATAPLVAPTPTKVAPVKPLYPVPKPLETHPLLHPGHQYEFLVKYKQRSFVHAEWVPQVVIERAKLGKQRLQRFLAKGPECDPDLPFDPEYVEVDRVLDREERDGTLYYFVKWQGLPYNECTWESSEEVNDAHAVEEYERHNLEPAVRVDYNAPTPRPAPGEWAEKNDAEFKDGNQLRPYQHEGMNWLRYCWYHHRNSILADEMGLGKTVQTVSMLWYLFKYRNIRGPFMIIAPLSTIPHWRRELENWTDMNCLVYHGNAEARQIIRDYEFHYLDDNGRPKLKNMFKFHVIVTTYEMILTDSEILRPVRWKYIAIDEAHRLKNKASRVLNEFLTFHYDHLLLLTGTPIQNNTQELWTLLNLLDPVQFSSAEDFVAAFGNLKDAEQVKRLHDILKPFLLRRMKDDVDKTIAPKEETIIEVELTTIQKKYYRAILERSFDNLVQGSKSRSALPSLLNIMMQLRKCCNHPYLLKGVEEAELGIQEQSVEGATPGDTLIESSGKLVLIDKLLPRLKEEGHKILIFSQMVRVIDILQEYLNARGYKFERIDGAVRGNDRQAAIDRFSKPDSDIFVFLLCTRAGGVGINLTAADTVIIFDSDWNPQNDLQAQARCHRIGQQRSVKVYRLLTRGTYERVMFERASLKLGLDQAVFSHIHDGAAEEEGGRPKFTSSEVDSLLKHGAYDLFREDDKASDQFREANIEDILLSRTTRIVHDNSAQVGSTFSKASFTSQYADTELDVNDPDFWKKVMPHQAHKPNPNIIEQPRQRKQRQRVAHEILGGDSDEEGLDYSDEEDAGGRESDDELFEDFDGDKRGWRRGEKGERQRKPTGPIFHRRKWNMTQRNRFVRAIQLVGFGRWREIKRNAKLTNKSLWEIACYGRAYVRILLRFAGLTEGDTEDKLVSRIINCEDGLEDLTEDPWRSSSKRQMAAYELHKQESEAGVPADMIAEAEARYAKRLEWNDAQRAKEQEYIAGKMGLLKQTKMTELLGTLTTVNMGGSGPTPATALTPDMVPEELPPSDDAPIVIHWHLHDEAAIAAEVAYFTDEDPLLTDTRFLDNTKSTASQAVKRLELLSEVGALVRSNFGEFSHEPFPKIEGGDTAFFTDNWTVCHDRDLLVGTWRWGFGQYDRMVRDPFLSYYGFYKPKPIKERGGKGDDDDDEDGLGNGGDDDDDGGDGAAPNKKTPKKVGAKRAASRKNLKAGDQSSVAPSPAGTPAPGSNAMDVDSAVPSASTTPAPPVLTGIPEGVDPATLLDMPPSKLLTHRVKHLLKAFSSTRRKRNQTEQKEKKRLEKEKEKEEKHRRRVDKESSWSKRERSEFTRTIQANGVPLRRNPATGEFEEDWEGLHARSALHNKSVNALRGYYADFAITCRYLAAVKNAGPEEKIDEGLMGGLTEAQLTDRAAEYHLTPMAARRIWERISTFDTLRREVLTQTGLEAKLARATPTGYGLMAWWLIPQFDVALLRAVDKHGFGKWAHVCTDPALPFGAAAKANMAPDVYAAAAAKPVKKEVEDEDDDKDQDDDTTKDLWSSFLPSEKLLWKRVQYLVQLATTDPLSAAAMAGSTGRANGKKKAAAMAAYAAAAAGGADLLAEEDEEGRAMKKRRRDVPLAAAEAEIPDSVAKRPRFSAQDSEVKLEFDEAGNPIMPIVIKGVLAVESLGVINPASAFHSEKYIWPVGFVSKREYASAVIPDGRTHYKCEILASPEGTPLFRVSAEDDPSVVCEASSASQAWKLVLDRVNKVKIDSSKRSSVSGPEYFGFGNPKIAELIAKLPGADACIRYHAAQAPIDTPKRKKRERADNGTAARYDDDAYEEDDDYGVTKRRKLTAASSSDD